MQESSVALASVCWLPEEERVLPWALKIKGQDRIGPVVGIADERNNVSQGEEVGQGGAVFWRSQPGWEED